MEEEEGGANVEKIGEASDCGPIGDAVAKICADLKSSSDENETEESAAREEAAATAAARTALVLEEDLQFESGFISFPEKLMSLLEGDEVQDSMWWLPGGDAFCLVPASFNAILEKHFQGTKFESFTRKLNRW